METEILKEKKEEKMGKVLMYAAFFIALLAMGQATAETNFGEKAGDFFAPSTFILILAYFLFLIGEILERRKEEKNAGGAMRFFTKR